MNRAANSSEMEAQHEPLIRPQYLEQEEENDTPSTGSFDAQDQDEIDEQPFSWIAYSIFVLLGIAMLWSWNMFLAAAPYFQYQFKSDQWILNHFQAAETSVATVTNLLTMLVLNRLQEKADYPRRIVYALSSSTIIFTILAISTNFQTSARSYFGFLLIIILSANLSAGTLQHGVFAFTLGLGLKEYTQAIMTGQAVAGVLPPLLQIISVVATPNRVKNDGSSTVSPKAASAYFITASILSVSTLVVFFYLLPRQHTKTNSHLPSNDPLTHDAIEEVASKNDNIRKSIPMTELFMKIPYLSLAIILCFGITMAFPVITSITLSVNGIEPAIFIPLAFLVWNIGDLAGRLITVFPQVSISHYPFALFCMAMARLLFIPLYFLCNIKGRGAVIESDLFYLAIVQFFFGLTNGYIGTTSMIAAGQWVSPEQREAVGGYTALCLVAGLAAGSLLSFSLGDA